MKRCVEEGLIGEPYVIESRVEGSRGMPSGWRTIKSLGGGMMLDWGVHLIDQMMYMFDDEVTEVYCKMFSIDYPGGIHGYIASILKEDGINVRTVTMDDEEFGLSDEILRDTDVLMLCRKKNHMKKRRSYENRC